MRKAHAGKLIVDDQLPSYGDISRFITDAIVIFNSSWECIFSNIAAQKYINKKKLVGKTLWELFSLEKTAEESKKILRAGKARKPSAFTFYLFHLKKWFAIQIYPKKESTLLIFQDITDKKKLEKDLKTSEERFRTIVEQSNEAIQFIDPLGRVLYTSPSVKRVLGYTSQEVMSHTPQEYVHPEDLPLFSEAFQQLVTHPKKVVQLHYRVKHKNGSWAWMEAEGRNELKNPVVHAIVGNFRNITRQKMVENALRASRDQLHAIFRNIADGIIVQDGKGNIIFANNTGIRLTSETIIGTKDIATYKRFEKKYDILDEKGNPFPFSQLPGLRAIAGEINPSVVIQYINKKTKEVKWSSLTSTVIFTGEGKVEMIVNVISDVTERKELDSRKDDFIAMVAHELRTPITSTQMYIHAALKECKDNPKAVIVLGKIQNQIDKLNALINTMLDITRLEQGKLIAQERSFMLKNVALTAVKLIKDSTDHPLHISWKTKEYVYGDKEKVSQVFTNLIMNAIKYSPSKSDIIIKSQRKGKCIIVSIQDFGIGIAKEEQKHIFDRFYQSEGHRTYSGLGLGLYLSSEIIKQHKGEMWVESKKGKGSTFYFSLPIYKQVK